MEARQGINTIDGISLRPLFYSEISSSYLLFQVFKDHPRIAKEFVRTFLDLDVQETEASFAREHMYAGKGAIDILLVFKGIKRRIAVLIEIKVHDYQSATSGQIRTYFEAALQETEDTEVCFVYLTQFSRNNFNGNTDIAIPPTILEFDQALQMKGYKDRIKHINWDELHSFIDQFRGDLSAEQAMMLDLHSSWIKAECQVDRNDKRIEVGDRGISDYFPDIEVDITKELPFGEAKAKNKRRVFSVKLASLSVDQYGRLLDVIGTFLESSSIDKTVVRKTEEYTLAAAKEYLAGLAQDEMSWGMLSFYSSLFHMVNSRDYVFFNGTGSRGFSIKVGIKKKGEISLCTLWANKTVEFSLTR